MRTGILVVASGLALVATACTPPYAGRGHWGGALKPVSKLDCPESKGELTRVSANPDGQSCEYAGDKGAQVRLSLIKVSTDPDSALESVETELKTLAPPPAPRPEPPATPEPPSAPTRSAEEDPKNVNIALPGVSIHAGEDKANISVGGLHIDADGESDSVHMQGGHGPFDRHGRFTVDANDGGAIIRSRAGGRDVRASLILASDHPGPQGWKVVGYEARGPRSGPLVVATVKIKSDEHDDVFKDAKALVQRSAGG